MIEPSLRGNLEKHRSRLFCDFNAAGRGFDVAVTFAFDLAREVFRCGASRFSVSASVNDELVPPNALLAAPKQRHSFSYLSAAAPHAPCSGDPYSN